MDHQDFKPVILIKNKPKPKNQNIFPKESKQDYDGLVEVPKTFTKDFGKKLSSFRTTSNMSRKDLALKLNLKESVISDIENGKQLYDGNLVHKLKRVFPSL
jgi:ribosome-binding protein aMBF1 (putative translation factor)